ncbi:70 kDa peptidyl-prolyl isomerase [Bienertia sinuspersici]
MVVVRLPSPTSLDRSWPCRFDPEDTSCLFSYIDDLDNPKEILEHIKEFRKDGNSFFRKGDVDSALEEDKETFVNITCVVLLNMATCLLRKNKFMPTGKFCAIVLDLNPRSVKALFRRASAAMELGRFEFAVLDPELAYVIDPLNQEVCKKLGEVKAKTLEELEDLSESPEVDMRDGMLEDEPPLRVDTALNLTQIKIGGDIMTKLEVEKTKKAKGSVEVEKPKEVEMKDADCSRKCGRGRVLMESKHRFHNRRHHGSFLNISKRDYSKLTQGKTFQYYNSRSGVIMSMRVVGCQKVTTKRGVNQKNNSFVSDSNLINEFIEEVGDNFNDQSLNQCERKLQSMVSINQPEGDDIIQSISGPPRVDYLPKNPYEQDHFSFQLGSGKSGKVRGLTIVMRKNKRKNRNRVKNVERNNNENFRNSHYISSNHLCRCRFKVEGVAERKEHPQVKNLIHLSYRCGNKKIRASTFTGSSPTTKKNSDFK